MTSTPNPTAAGLCVLAAALAATFAATLRR